VVAPSGVAQQRAIRTAKRLEVARIDAEIVADGERRNLQEVLKWYAFGPFRLDADRGLLLLDAEPLALGPRVVATLSALVERAGDLVTKDEILDRVWGSEDVGESNVAQSVYTLRKVLREHGLGAAIATVPRRGYRFVAPVERLSRTPMPEIPLQPLPVAGRPRRSAWPWLPATLVALVLVAIGAVPAARERTSPPPLSARGAELYRLGRYYWNQRTRAQLAKSARLFAAVVASDPRSPLGYAGEADADLMIADYGAPQVKPAFYYARARREIRSAMALDRDSAAAHTSLGMLMISADHDVAGGFAEFRHAIALDPGYAIAHHWYGTLLFKQGDLAEASRELHAAVALDPVDAATGAWLAEASYFDHRYHDAIVYARLALDLDPQRGGALRRLGLAYELSGDLPHAIAAFKRMRGAEAAWAPGLLAEAYARAGRRDAASAALRDAVRLHPRDDDTAFALLAAGDRARGLAILDHMPRAMDDTPLEDPRIEPFRAALRARESLRTPTG
jgi:DNA-binding winged helix-turn-helix (wHTH) protein/Flp pilus assembly protein TadD